MSTTLKNIKIPYPTEGVIRSAQLDDTVAPENSVQTAVNMNFDRVGALQTRPGIGAYADDLTGEIQNFGTLNNSVIPSGYTSLTKMLPTDTFETVRCDDMSSARVDDTHVILSWKGVDGDGYIQVMKFDVTTGEMTPMATALEFDASNGSSNAIIRVDGTHFLNLWSGTTNHGFAQIFTIDGAYEVTAIGSPFEFDNANAISSIDVAQIDANHFIAFHSAGTTGAVLALAVNLGTWAVTAAGATFTFEATSVSYNSCASSGDGTHFVNFWRGVDGDGFTQAFAVNLGTWAITKIGTALEYDTSSSDYNSACALGDGKHFVNFWSTTSQLGLARVFNMDPSTFAMTAVGSANLTFDATFAIYLDCLPVGDGQHIVNFWVGPRVGSDYYGYTQMFEVNLTTFDLTAVRQPISLGIVFIGARNSSILLSTYNIVNFWKSTNTTGVGGLFKLKGDPNYYNLLYAQQGDGTVYNWDGANWTSVRSGLNNNQKARFAQFLNYLWMVNGNSSIGDAVATSNGGAFGTDLVPVGLPAGDFIQAGFEGRVWIVDSLLDILYYTDIVQFTPPDVYTLTFNSGVNFIQNFSPQNGETFTGICEVPRALLLFKQNHIYRVYGANSIDAYPAYNVGTYSQESIIKAKDGIYFHHSSGFYKFDYNSQPIEISRRVIDFVKAIPRANYESITGIWDGFDAVKWTVGAVTVEGVTYSNCQMRYTISTQTWTIYDYEGNTITAMITFDDGTDLNQVMGTTTGIVAALDVGTTDLGEDIYFEMIDRWRSFTEMYSKSKSVSGIMVSSDNGAGTVLEYQTEKSQPNAYTYIDTLKDQYDALFPNASTDDFNNLRFRLRGNTRGTPIIFHGIELLSIQDKGINQN